jgi:hypothetical protein
MGLGGGSAASIKVAVAAIRVSMKLAEEARGKIDLPPMLGPDMDCGPKMLVEGAP